VFAVHGVGGILGSLLVAYLALPAFGGLGLADGVSAASQLWVQFSSVIITVIWTTVASFVILKVIAAVTNGLRVDTQDEIEGLDITQHGEYGYHTK
ncbi:MAG: ammonia channel protein, partial [Candidatus Puniceispirillum sp.]